MARATRPACRDPHRDEPQGLERQTMTASPARGRPGRSRRARAAARVLLVLGGAGAGVLALAGPAFAHVKVSPSSAQQGSTAELTFRVPNEESKAATVELQLQVPTAHPIAQFLVKPVPGWKISVQTVQLPKPVVTDDGSFTTAVSEVTWTGGTIEPGQYQDFSVSADPLPSGISQLDFKAIQTYSNGDVLRWIDLSQPGQPEPAHPAPVLTLTAAGAVAGTPAAGAKSASGPDTTALALGAAGLAAGLLGLVAGGAAWRRAGRRSRPPGQDLWP
jgi:periplasmic copper chaperone A